MTKPLISVIIVAFDMSRELPRTVQSFLPPYQVGLSEADLEIIIADNGSSEPVRREWFPDRAPIRVLRIDDGGASPCRAINAAFATSTGEWVGIVIDGARMVTPGLLKMALAATRTAEEPLVSTLHFHLGPKPQQLSVAEGYTRAVEDGLLASINWPSDGYRLFEIAALGESARLGAAATPFESNFTLLSRHRFEVLGGFDERFRSIGGGLANWDFFKRAIETSPAATAIMLLGEANFHQLHYGATTQEGGVRRAIEDGKSLWDAFMQEYRTLRGSAYHAPAVSPLLFGALHHPKVAELYFPPVSPKA